MCVFVCERENLNLPDVHCPERAREREQEREREREREVYDFS